MLIRGFMRHINQKNDSLAFDAAMHLNPCFLRHRVFSTVILSEFS